MPSQLGELKMGKMVNAAASEGDAAAISEFQASCDAGRREAIRLIDDIRETKLTPALGYAVRNMIAAGVYGGFQIGFFQQIAEALVA